jgi:peptidylprolyl isomerase
MKAPVVILGTTLAIAALGCGGNGAATGSGETAVEPGTRPAVLDRDDPRFAVITDRGRRPMPVIHPKGGPPKRFVVRDVEVGSGPAAEPGDRIAVRYVGVDHETGEVLWETWPPREPLLVVELGADEDPSAWEEGIVGMRAGGRREMLIPAGLTREGPLDYVFDLLRVEPPA